MNSNSFDEDFNLKELSLYILPYDLIQSKISDFFKIIIDQFTILSNINNGFLYNKEYFKYGLVNKNFNKIFKNIFHKKIRELYTTHLQIFDDILDINTIKIFLINNKYINNGYIDFIPLCKIKYPIGIGVDSFQRPYITIRTIMDNNYPQDNNNSENNNNTNSDNNNKNIPKYSIYTLHTRYTDSNKIVFTYNHLSKNGNRLQEVTNGAIFKGDDKYKNIKKLIQTGEYINCDNKKIIIK